MFSRMLQPPDHKSFFLFGPRGTGKTTWVRAQFPNAVYIDLLEYELYTRLLANPGRLEQLIPPNHNDWIIIDEIQKIPALLNEVHRLIEHKKHRFVLTGSSARSLRRKGVNLLAGRAVHRNMHPLTAAELGQSFNLRRALEFGHLPSVFTEPDPEDYLKTYVGNYLREEVLQEGLTRNLEAFTRFLETAAFSQGSILNISEVARECQVSRKLAEGYFSLVEDLLIGTRMPCFTPRAKRRIIGHPKFFFFDVGVYRSLRAQSWLDTDAEIDGSGLETLFFQEARAINDYLRLKYQIYTWRTRSGLEVDFVLYGPNGLHAFEIKRSRNVGNNDLRGLRAFGSDYPEARLHLLYGGNRELNEGGIRVLPYAQTFKNLGALLTD